METNAKVPVLIELAKLRKGKPVKGCSLLKSTILEGTMDHPEHKIETVHPKVQDRARGQSHLRGAILPHHHDVDLLVLPTRLLREADRDQQSRCRRAPGLRQKGIRDLRVPRHLRKGVAFSLLV